MIEITVLGRGGQGVVKAAQLLAISAFLSGFESQASPMFGVERRGAPVNSFVRVDKEPIKTRAQITKADFAIVLDSTLLNMDINAKEVIVNSKKHSRYRNLDAETIATRILPQGINTVMVAAFAFFTKIISKEMLIKACRELFDVNVADKNIRLIEETFSILEK